MAAAATERSFWLDTVDRPAFEVELPNDVDVLVVGAGFTGLSAALALAKRGVSTLVAEAEHVGWGASSRNGGMALTGLKRPVEWLIARFGIEHARRLFALSLESIGCVERIIDEEGIACEFARCGHVEAACKERHFEHLRRTAELLGRQFDHEVRVIGARSIPTELASDRYHGALIDESSAGLNPAKFALGLATAAKAHGASIAERTRVDAIAKTHRAGTVAYSVTTSRGPVRAGAVLVATGAYTSAMTPGLRERIVRIGSYVIATEPLAPDLAAELIPRGRMIFDTNNFLHYYRLTADARLLFGGRAAFAPADARTVRESADILRRAMVDVFPQVRDMKIGYAWGGCIDVTFDVLPHAGVLDGLHYAIGYAGHGVAMATLAGERMTRIIVGDDASADAGADVLGCGPLPNPPPGLSGASPWFLPIAGAWYRFLDWAS